jgi:RNA polymerase sigma factor (sigma-70 family)
MPGRSAAIMSEPSFADLVERLQNNEREAVDLLVARYGRALRRAIDRALFERRVASAHGALADGDASDVYQTVLLLFLVRLRRGESGNELTGPLSFETPGHLVAYLKTIAANEIRRRYRRGGGAGRIIGDGSLTDAGGASGPGLPGIASAAASSEPSPSECLILRELLERDQAALAEIDRRLRPEEQAIWVLVRQELSWPEIARRLGRSAEALRKTFSRAIRRIAAELGSGSSDHGRAPER